MADDKATFRVVPRVEEVITPRSFHSAPPPIPSPPVTPPPFRPAPPRPRKLRRRVPLPSCWAKLGASDLQDELGEVLKEMFIKSIPRPISRDELPKVWDALAARAQELGREPLLIYQGRSGRERVRMRAWLGYRVRADGDSHAMAATIALPLDAARHRLRAAAHHPAHMARLRGNRLTPLL